MDSEHSRRIRQEVGKLESNANMKNVVFSEAQSTVTSLVLSKRIEPHLAGPLVQRIKEELLNSEETEEGKLLAIAGQAFNNKLKKISAEKPGVARDFVEMLQKNLQEQWKNTPADTKPL